MSQEAVEKLLGRMITDRRFCAIAGDSLEMASRQAGYCLSPAELSLLSDSLKLQRFSELGDLLSPGLQRA